MSFASYGACPYGALPATASEPSLGRSVGVGTVSPACKLSRVSSVSWNRAGGLSGIDEATLRTMPPE